VTGKKQSIHGQLGIGREDAQHGRNELWRERTEKLAVFFSAASRTTAAVEGAVVSKPARERPPAVLVPEGLSPELERRR
jgi:hypothetical protein